MGWANKNGKYLEKRTSFTDFKQIEDVAIACFNKIPNGYLENLTFDEFAYRIAELYNDINHIHPFREGNGRVERVFFTQLIREHGYDINFSEIDTDELMAATIYAAGGVMDLLIDFFKEAITDPNTDFNRFYNKCWGETNRYSEKIVKK